MILARCALPTPPSESAAAARRSATKGGADIPQQFRTRSASSSSRTIEFAPGFAEREGRIAFVTIWDIDDCGAGFTPCVCVSFRLRSIAVRAFRVVRSRHLRGRGRSMCGYVWMKPEARKYLLIAYLLGVTYPAKNYGVCMDKKKFELNQVLHFSSICLIFY